MLSFLNSPRSLRFKILFIRYTRWIPFTIGMAMIVTSIYVIITTVLFLSKAHEAEAIVVRVDEAEKTWQNDETGREYQFTIYRPWVKYEDHEGVSHEVVLKKETRDEDYSVGQEICLLYDPENPKKVAIDNNREIWGDSIGLICFGSVLICIFYVEMAFIIVFRGQLEEIEAKKRSN